MSIKNTDHNVNKSINHDILNSSNSFSFSKDYQDALVKLQYLQLRFRLAQADMAMEIGALMKLDAMARWPGGEKICLSLANDQHKPPSLYLST
ncbi:hypothetical protein CH63R_09656 [Colletotrichum higginsianum IMI 349063]|uniref:Uncharacterized protein n=1 Tax=Colletotrichum higginsianum (strain IMI 349063) TaxID=759273 RepID=A0A1B7Y885_COLHI|nr:hypothetical protein CH63R_09656 [Colletotrichum higginsianum IMI 349063]OBR08135.1 hypothetical protein CH63R_09656 [Colletotrichum higginsianum IMI 349063]